MAILKALQYNQMKPLLAAALIGGNLLFAPLAQASEIIRLDWQQVQNSTDPLKGLDLQKLEAEKMRLSDQKKSPEAAATLALLPSAGHFYAGQTARGAWVLGGFAGTALISFLSSYLLSSIDNDVARTAAVIANVAPLSAYWAWNITDAYYQTELNNEHIDQKIRDISLKQKEYGYYSTILNFNF